MKKGQAIETLNAVADEVFDDVADAVSMSKIAAKHGVSRRSLFNWIGRPENRDRYEQAKRESADTWAEKGNEYLEQADGETAPEVSLVKLRVDYCMRMATIRNRDEYGERPVGVNMNLNIGQLHLDALRQVGRASQPLQNGETVNAGLLESSNG